MKKGIAVIFIFLFLPLLTHAVEKNYTLPPTSVADTVGVFFVWILIFATPIIVLAAIILVIKHFLKKDIENKKKFPVSRAGMIIKLIIPYSIFAGMFVFSKHQVGYACDCFANGYEKIIVDAIAFIFLIGSIWITYLMKKNNKEWNILYTLLIIISFLIIFYSVMAVGDYFYISDF